MITSGHYIYLVILFVYLPIQIVSMLLPTILNLKKTKVISKEQKKARKKQFIMQGVMIIVFFIVTISIAAGVAIYWIFSAFIQILQTLGFHYLRVRKRKKGKDKNMVFQKIKGLFKKKNVYQTTSGETIHVTPTKKTKTGDQVSYNPIAPKNKNKTKFSLHNKNKKRDKK